MEAKHSITDIDGDIADAQNSLSLYPRSHFIHIISVYTLMMARFNRFVLSQQKEDLDKSILHCTEAIFLPPVPWAGPSLGVVRLLFHLASGLLYRAKKFEQPEGVKYFIGYFRYLRGLPLESFDAFAIQVVSEAEDGAQNTEEMVVLCRELLTSNLSASFPVAVSMSLNEADSVQSLDKEVCPPGSHLVLFSLSHTLSLRFVQTHSNDDYEEATTLLERVFDPNRPGECPYSIRDLASSLTTLLACAKPIIFQDPKCSEVSTSRLRTLLGSSPVDEKLRLQIVNMLAIRARDRFNQYSLAESLEEANSYTSQVVDLSSGGLFLEPDAVRGSYSMARMAEKIQHLEELLSITPPGTEHHKECLRHLADWYKSKFYLTNDISDIEESIKYGRLSLDATPYSNSSDWWRISPLHFLRDILFLAFKKTRKISYLDESITVGYDLLGLKSAQYIHLQIIQQLVLSLRTRSKLSGRREDLLEALRLIPLGVNSQYAPEPERFRLSCQWAHLARSVGHPTTSTAYKNAMSLVQKSLSSTPTVSIQHARLVAMGENCQSMPLDYASYQEAIETLEQGRALLWSEMRGLRIQMAQLIEENPPLAKRFAEVNQELEALTISDTPSGKPGTEDGVSQRRDWTDPFGRLVPTRVGRILEGTVIHHSSLRRLTWPRHTY
ncbi:hypothetical protein H4582DRAFT_1918949 [Lactarius indigo]|nr:hypothetical protein H4582DRAFT_1918949 [Lactarius indigo]